MGTMSEYVRRIARRARRLGFRAEHLGQMTDDQWQRVRIYLDVEDATDHELADAVSHMIRCQEGLADCEQIVDLDPGLDAYGTVG